MQLSLRTGRAACPESAMIRESLSRERSDSGDDIPRRD